MKLLTSLPARKDGTLNVSMNDGMEYTFTGMPLACEVEDVEHQERLQALGFMDQEAFDTEQKFLAQQAARAARLAAAEGNADDDDMDSGDGLPVEERTPATGRVRRARK